MFQEKTVKVNDINDVPYLNVVDGNLKVEGSDSMTDSFWILIQRLNPNKSLEEIKGKLGII